MAGALLPGRKAKPALGSLAVINCVILAAKGINLPSEAIMYYYYSACSELLALTGTYFLIETIIKKKLMIYSNK